MATLLKVLNNLADIKSAGGVALRVRTQGARFERGDRRPSGRRGGGGEAQQPQRLFEEEGADRDLEARSAHSSRPGGDVRSEADCPLSAPVSGLRREDRVDVRARHDRSRDPGASARALWPGGLARS